MLVELIVTARMPARSAAAIWLRISASSGETITVGPAPCGAQQQRGDEVDRRLAPAGALHDQRPAPVDGQRLDRRPLVVAQRGVVAADERRQVGLGASRRTSVVGRRGGHGACLPAGDRPRGLRPLHSVRSSTSRYLTSAGLLLEAASARPGERIAGGPQVVLQGVPRQALGAFLDQRAAHQIRTRSSGSSHSPSPGGGLERPRGTRRGCARCWRGTPAGCAGRW